MFAYFVDVLGDLTLILPGGDHDTSSKLLSSYGVT